MLIFWISFPSSQAKFCSKIITITVPFQREEEYIKNGVDFILLCFVLLQNFSAITLPWLHLPSMISVLAFLTFMLQQVHFPPVYVFCFSANSCSSKWVSCSRTFTHVSLVEFTVRQTDDSPAVTAAQSLQPLFDVLEML